MQETNQGKTKSNSNKMIQPTTLLIATEMRFLFRTSGQQKPVVTLYHHQLLYHSDQGYYIIIFITYVTEYIVFFL